MSVATKIPQIPQVYLVLSCRWKAADDLFDPPGDSGIFRLKTGLATEHSGYRVYRSRHLRIFIF